METSQVMAGVVLIGIIGLLSDQMLRWLHLDFFALDWIGSPRAMGLKLSEFSP